MRLPIVLLHLFCVGYWSGECATTVDGPEDYLARIGDLAVDNGGGSKLLMRSGESDAAVTDHEPRDNH